MKLGVYGCCDTLEDDATEDLAVIKTGQHSDTPAAVVLKVPSLW